MIRNVLKPDGTAHIEQQVGNMRYDLTTGQVDTVVPAAYAENATAAVISDDGGHVVVDVDLNGSAPVGDATEQADMKSSQGESVSDAEPDEALKAFEALMTANDIIIRSAFYYILLPSLFAMALPLLLYELLELHDRRRL